MKLTRAERLLIGQIVNVKLDTATLKDHLMLEGIFRAVDPDGIKFPNAPDFVPKDKQELFQSYNGKQIRDIENPEHQKILQKAVMAAKEEESKIWSNEDPEEEQMDIKFKPEQITSLKNFYETDRRPIPRQYHLAIVSLNDKLESKKKAKTKKE